MYAGTSPVEGSGGLPSLVISSSPHWKIYYSGKLSARKWIKKEKSFKVSFWLQSKFWFSAPIVCKLECKILYMYLDNYIPQRENENGFPFLLLLFITFFIWTFKTTFFWYVISEKCTVQYHITVRMCICGLYIVQPGLDIVQYSLAYIVYCNCTVLIHIVQCIYMCNYVLCTRPIDDTFQKKRFYCNCTYSIFLIYLEEPSPGDIAS
jgi:hypothetical protein